MLTTATRSGRTESAHRGAVAVVRGDELWLAFGAVDRPVYARSATKPFQALPFLERGLDRALGCDRQELAVMCASHEGTEAHTAAVRRLLARGGLREQQLGCGPQAPFDAAAERALQAAGTPPGRVHNNCSGKHAGFLLLAQACGDDLARYLDPGCRSQLEVAAAVAAMAGLARPAEVGVDGCGAPTFFLPLEALARAFARLANPGALRPVRAAACRTILDAAGAEPELLAGAGRLCTALVRTQPGRILPKNGAEGVYAFALAPDPARARCPEAVGVAIKVEDGNKRGYQAVAVDLLRWLGAFGPGDAVPAPLARFHVQPLHDTRGERIGEVRCALDWSSA